MLNSQPLISEPIPWDSQKNSIQYDLPGFGMVAFQFDYVPPKARTRERTKTKRNYERKTASKVGKTHGKGISSRKSPVKNKG